MKTASFGAVKPSSPDSGDDTLAKQTPAEKFKSIHAAMTPEEKGCWPADYFHEI
jgi:hypothetical protein